MTYAAFREESRTKFANATQLDGKSGERRGEPALKACDFFNLFVFLQMTRCFSILPQSRHPERSASQVYWITEGLWREVEGPRR